MLGAGGLDLPWREVRVGVDDRSTVDVCRIADPAQLLDREIFQLELIFELELRALEDDVSEILVGLSFVAKKGVIRQLERAVLRRHVLRTDERCGDGGDAGGTPMNVCIGGGAFVGGGGSLYPGGAFTITLGSTIKGQHNRIFSLHLLRLC